MSVIRIIAYINLVNSMQVTRVLTINLTRSLNNEQLTIINHLTYSASKLWNTSNYEVIQRNIKPNKIDVQMKNNFWFKNLHSQSAQAVCQKLQIRRKPSVFVARLLRKRLHGKTTSNNTLKDHDTNQKMDTFP